MFRISSNDAVKAAHLILPMACTLFGYVMAGEVGYGIAVLTLMVTHVSQYADRSTWRL